MNLTRALRLAVALLLSLRAPAQLELWSAVGQELPTFRYMEGPVALTSDLDGDGVRDILHAVQIYNGPRDRFTQYCEEVWTLSGATGRVLRRFCPRSEWAIYDLAAMDDVDGDGAADYAITTLAAGHPFWRVQVWSWQQSRMLWEVFGLAEDLFGSSILGNLDLDGDGRGDLVLTVPIANNRNGEVRAYAHDGRLLHRVVGSIPDRIGAYPGNHRLGKVGDVDGDGCDDYVVAGADERVAAWTAYVISGRTGAVARRGVSRPEEFVGFLCVDGCGDIDGDGVPDFLGGGTWGSPWGGILVVFSGSDGHRIRTHVQSGDFGRVARGGGVDLDRDATPDYVVASPPQGPTTVFSGRTGEPVVTVRPTGNPVARHIGEFVVAVPPMPGSPFGNLVLTDREYIPNGGTFSVGRIRMIRGSHPDVQDLGAGCPGSIGLTPQMGMTDRGPQGLRLHLTGSSGGLGVLLLGGSRDTWGGVRLPLRLGDWGFPDCRLFGSIETMIWSVPMAGGYSYVDVPLPLALRNAAQFNLVGQWLVVSHAPALLFAMSRALEWWH